MNTESKSNIREIFQTRLLNMRKFTTISIDVTRVNRVSWVGRFTGSAIKLLDALSTRNVLNWKLLSRKSPVAIL